MLRRILVSWCAVLSGLALADGVPLVEYNSIEVPITPFSNMESGHQATNPGFRLMIRDEGGEFIAGGPLTMDSVIKGRSDDASSGTPYGKLILSVEMQAAYPGIAKGIMSGEYHGVLSICMAQDLNSKIENTQCRSLGGNTDRPYEYLNKKIDFTVQNGNIRITKYYGGTGDGGTSEQLSLAIFHPAFGFAAPGKAFKDYQSPLVLDLDHNGKLDLVNVWNERTPIRFDLNGTGEKVRTGWVKPTDGLLFLDDGSGCAKNGTQFFGEYTGSKNGKPTQANGFRALAALLDSSGSGKVVAALHPELKVWRNLAQDGICKRSEVSPASKYVKEIYLSYVTHEDVKLQEDNEVRLTGKYLGTDGHTHLIGDVWFKQRRNALAKN